MFYRIWKAKNKIENWTGDSGIDNQRKGTIRVNQHKLYITAGRGVVVWWDDDGPTIFIILQEKIADMVWFFSHSDK